jgi:N-acetylglutamate synthase-like GNAT family acetyltransferase
MKIRRATLKDIKKIARLSLEYGKYENKLNKSVKVGNLADVEKEDRKWYQLGTKYLLAEENKEVLGMMAFNLGKIGKEKVGIIHTVIIMEKARGKGVGNSLVSYVLDYFNKNKCRRVKSFVHIENKNAFNFWTKKGFVAEEGYAIQKMLK